MARDDFGLVLVGAGALLILTKWGIGNINVPNPFPAAGQAAKKTAEEVTGGLRKSPDETWDEWAFQFDPPFTDKRFPMFPGLVRDEGEAYTTETTGAVAMDIQEPRQSYGDYLTEFDLPGLPAYDLKDAPGDIYRGIRSLF